MAAEVSYNGPLKLVDRIERWAAMPGRVIPVGFLISLLFVLFGPYVNYAPKGNIDPWLYTGYFTNYSYIQAHYGTMYYFSRLPWTIPGLIVFQLANPTAGSLLLNACLVATCAIIFVLRDPLALRDRSSGFGGDRARDESVVLHDGGLGLSGRTGDRLWFPGSGICLEAAWIARNQHRSDGSLLALSGFTNMSGRPWWCRC